MIDDPSLVFDRYVYKR